MLEDVLQMTHLSLFWRVKRHLNRVNQGRPWEDEAFDNGNGRIVVMLDEGEASELNCVLEAFLAY